MSAGVAICGIAAAATSAVILRPWRLPEAVWPAAGAVLLITLGLLPPSDAWRGIAKGTDVYLFLAGMMLLAELARAEGLFDWMACRAAQLARGSATRLFDLVYLVGIVVTIFLSNDATAIVLTPAIAAVARTVGAERPLPYLFACAFVANAASFVLPISNPANLVIYGSQMPPLFQWLPRYAMPSLLAIGATWIVLRMIQRRSLRREIAADVPLATLTFGGKTAAGGIAATSVLLMLASAFGLRLGLPTFLAGLATVVIVLLRTRQAPWPLVRDILLGRPTARRGVVRARRGGGPSRDDSALERPAAHDRCEFYDAHHMECGSHCCGRQQSDQQPARRSHRRNGSARRACSVLDYQRRADRGRPWTEPVGHRFVGDPALGQRAAPRRAPRRAVDVPQARRCRHATGPRPRARQSSALQLRRLPVARFRPASLDALNFLLADVRGALGPYLNVFLVTQQHGS